MYDVLTIFTFYMKAISLFSTKINILNVFDFQKAIFMSILNLIYTQPQENIKAYGRREKYQGLNLGGDEIQRVHTMLFF